MTRVTLTLPVRMALCEMIKDHCVGVPQNDGSLLAHYDPGWNDSRVLKEISELYPEINATHVANARGAICGKLYAHRAPKSKPQPTPDSGIGLLAKLFREHCMRTGANDLANMTTQQVLNPSLPLDGE